VGSITFEYGMRKKDTVDGVAVSFENDARPRRLVTVPERTMLFIDWINLCATRSNFNDIDRSGADMPHGIGTNILFEDAHTERLHRNGIPLNNVTFWGGPNNW